MFSRKCPTYWCDQALRWKSFCQICLVCWQQNSWKLWIAHLLWK